MSSWSPVLKLGLHRNYDNHLLSSGPMRATSAPPAARLLPWRCFSTIFPLLLLPTHSPLCLPPFFEVCLDQAHFFKIRGDFLFSLLRVCLFVCSYVSVSCVRVLVPLRACTPAHPSESSVKSFVGIVAGSEAQQLVKHQLSHFFASSNTTCTTSPSVTSCQSTWHVSVFGLEDNAAVAMVTEHRSK